MAATRLQRRRPRGPAPCRVNVSKTCRATMLGWPAGVHRIPWRLIIAGLALEAGLLLISQASARLTESPGFRDGFARLVVVPPSLVSSSAASATLLAGIVLASVAYVVAIAVVHRAGASVRW